MTRSRRLSNVLAAGFAVTGLAVTGLAVAELVVAAAAAQESRRLSPFNRLEVDTAISVTLACGDEPAVRIESDPPVIAERYLDLTIAPGADGAGIAKLHFRRDFDRWVHPDRLRVLLTTDRPLRDVTATTGARLTLPPCALDREEMTLRAQTGARIEVSGRTALLILKTESGGTFNALSGGRGFVADRVRLNAGRQARVGLCQAGKIEILQQADDARVLTDC